MTLWRRYQSPSSLLRTSRFHPLFMHPKQYNIVWKCFKSWRLWLRHHDRSSKARRNYLGRARLNSIPQHWTPSGANLIEITATNQFQCCSVDSLRIEGKSKVWTLASREFRDCVANFCPAKLLLMPKDSIPASLWITMDRRNRCSVRQIRGDKIFSVGFSPSLRSGLIEFIFLAYYPAKSGGKNLTLLEHPSVYTKQSFFRNFDGSI